MHISAPFFLKSLTAQGKSGCMRINILYIRALDRHKILWYKETR